MNNIKDIIKKTFLYSIYRYLRVKIEYFITALSWIWIRFFLAFPSKHFRIMCLNMYKGVDVKKDSALYGHCEWWYGPMKIGHHCNIGFHSHLDAREGLFIGDRVCLATGVTIWTRHHDYNSKSFACKGGPVTIGNYAWICSRSIILPNVTIGEGAVVASGAVVTKDVEPWTIVGGVPAKKIGERERKEYDYKPGAYWIPFV